MFVNVVDQASIFQSDSGSYYINAIQFVNVSINSHLQSQLKFESTMSIAQKLEANEAQPTSSHYSDELGIPMNPFAPTRAQFILLMIGLFCALERRSIIRILPFHIGLLGGIIPPECLMWTLILADMAQRDIVQLWVDIKAPSSKDSIDSAERK